MVDGMERLRRAGNLLRSQPDEAERLGLLAAASETWSAMFDLERWPDELQTRAVALQRHLFRHGPIRQTVEEGDERERAALRHELLSLVDFAEEFCRRAASN
ncbi:MAG TPA: hypothetical protein VF170_01390 [Planctomycetaceae bacterium]